MSFTIYITLTSVGTEAGPFDIFSDYDGYVVPIQTNVPKSTLLLPYSLVVPDGTYNIRVKSIGDCVNFIDIPIQNLPTPTPTCPTTTQYLKVELQDSTKFKLSLWSNAGFTNPTTAFCNYTISGTAYGSLGTVYNGTETITTGQHQHQFDLKPVLLPGEVVIGFDVHSYTLAGCVCPLILVLPVPPTPTPSVTPTMTPTITNSPTVTNTPGLSPSPTETVTQTPSQTPSPTQTNTPSPTGSDGLLYVYGRYINSSQEFGYSLNGGPYIAIGEPTSTNCLYLGQISGLQNGDTLYFTTLSTCGINGDTADCPNSVGGCSYIYVYSGVGFVYITVDASNCC